MLAHLALRREAALRDDPRSFERHSANPHVLDQIANDACSRIGEPDREMLRLPEPYHVRIADDLRKRIEVVVVVARRHRRVPDVPRCAACATRRERDEQESKRRHECLAALTDRHCG
jgi:hypothetical protein